MTQPQIMMMESARNDEEYEKYADYIFQKHGGKAPDDWYEKIVASSHDRRKLENIRKTSC